jgi:hypothetical protein
MLSPKNNTSDADIYRNNLRVPDMNNEDPTTGEILDGEGAADPDNPYEDDENITGDEELYDSVENEEPADVKDVLEEQEDLEFPDEQSDDDLEGDEDQDDQE